MTDEENWMREADAADEMRAADEMDPPKCLGCDLRVCRCDEEMSPAKMLMLKERDEWMESSEEIDPILNDWESPETYDCDACKKVGHGCLTVASALGSDVHAPPRTLPPGWLRWAGFYACSPECAIIIWKRENLEK